MNWSRIFFGSLLAAVGVLLFLDSANVLNAGEAIAALWPVVIVIGGLFALASNPSHWVIPLILIVGGTALLLRTTEVVDTFAYVVPALLVLGGIALILGRGFGNRRLNEEGDRINSFNLFSGSELASRSAEFEGGNVGVVFGGAEIDLGEARLAPGAVLEVFAVFGGIELRVPEGWNVVTRGFPLFGGFDNATAKDKIQPDAPVLTVQATILFGGVEIRH